MKSLIPILAVLLAAFAWVPSVEAQCGSSQAAAGGGAVSATASSCGQTKARVRIFAKFRGKRGC